LDSNTVRTYNDGGRWLLINDFLLMQSIVQLLHGCCPPVWFVGPRLASAWVQLTFRQLCWLREEPWRHTTAGETLETGQTEVTQPVGLQVDIQEKVVLVSVIDLRSHCAMQHRISITKVETFVKPRARTNFIEA
jgi:hypothetical protein